MQVSIRGRNVDVTPALKEHVTRKLRKLDRFFDRPLPKTAQVTLSVQRDRHTVEVTIPLNGMLLRGEESSPDMYASVDLVIDKLGRQVEKYKARTARKLRPAAGDDLAEVLPDDADRVARVKRFPLRPMPIDEAITQMELLGHDFFVFLNADTDLVSVVYRRKDGQFGLIEPDR